MRRSAALLPVVLASVAAAPAAGAGQDVELLSEIHGTPLPEGYWRTLAQNPGAFRFTRGRAVRLRERVLELTGGASGGQLRSQASGLDPLSILGPREGPVEGTYRIPVLLGLFADSPPDIVPYPMATVQDAYFGDHPGTITAYYEEVSRGRVSLTGELQDWVRADVTQAAATGGESGLVQFTTSNFIVDLIRRLPTDIDWGVYDNDGPDGVPNSGDDDGFVDILTVLQPMHGGECQGEGEKDRIWSHKWNLTTGGYIIGGETNLRPYETTTPAAGGGTIRIDDYAIQPIYNCTRTALNEIGVFTHELGHAFGLPDLYDTNAGDGKHQGAGNWELMATGSYGCDGRSPESPCHMSAWSKMILGWADVETLPRDTDVGTLVLPPVETTGKVYRLNAADDSGEFYLLENRQRVGFDRNLYEEGMLVWRINQPIINAQWSGNGVNSYNQLGVWLREADGLNELAHPGCGRGNGGDPFPYVGPKNLTCGDGPSKDNRVFHAASNPSSMTDYGNASGATLIDIQRQGDDITFRVTTRFTRVTMRSEGDAGAGGLFTVDGAPVAEADHAFTSAPFLTHIVEAAPGEILGQGIRRPFLGWADAVGEPRVRTLKTPLDDLDMVARYGGEQYEVAVALSGGQGAVTPGTFTTTPEAPDLWFEAGTQVTVEAKPRQGFAFLGWTGALEGQPNPAALTVHEPVMAGADFELIYEVASTTVPVSAAQDPALVLEPENGTSPYQWTVLQGTLPQGLELSVLGQLTGAAMETGTYPLKVQVRDALGLTAQGEITLEVTDPDIPVYSLAQRFLLVGEQLTVPQYQYLDKKGNGDGTYDIGDFRAWVLAHPDLPLTASMKALVGPRVMVVPSLSVGTGPGSEVKR